jgi:TonB family protein
MIRLKSAVSSFVIVFFVLFLAGCASKPRLMVKDVDFTRILAQGELILDGSCGWDWGGHRREVAMLYSHGSWNKLAHLVYSLGCSQNLAYYYLGSSAEGLGYYDGAKKYYKTSILRSKEKPHRYSCGARCDGLVFPTDAENALSGMNTATELLKSGYSFLDVAMKFYHGRGTRLSYRQAFKWMKKSAEQGVVRGQYNLGLLYYNQQGVPYNYNEAVRWVRSAAVKGYVPAQRALLDMFTDGTLPIQTGHGIMKGLGDLENHQEAVKWYIKLAEQNNAPSKKYSGKNIILPKRSVKRKVAGWVRVKFTITKEGIVANADVMDSGPGNIYDAAALEAVRGFKFLPKIIGGNAVDQQAVELFGIKVTSIDHGKLGLYVTRLNDLFTVWDQNGNKVLESNIRDGKTEQKLLRKAKRMIKE